MWTIVVLSLVIAITNMLDVFTDIVAVAVIGVTPLQLGLFNSLAYVIFIFMLLLGSRLSERGIIRLQVLLTLLYFLGYGVLLDFVIASRNQLVLAAAYLVYSAAQALARTSAMAYIHEMYSSDLWEKLISRRAVVTVVCEALLMVVISVAGVNAVVTGINAVYFVAFLVLPALMALVLVKDPPLRIEKPMYMIDVGLSRVERLITSNLALYTLLTERDSLRWTSLKAVLYRSKHVEAGRILAALVIFRVSNAILLLQLPVYLAKTLGYTSSDMLRIYGLARFLLLVDLLLPSTTWRRAYLAMFARGLIPLLFLVQGLNSRNLAVAVVLGLIIYVNTKLDTALYSMYIDSLGRVETTRYLVIGELAGFLGTTVSGVVYSLAGYEGIVFVNVLLFALEAILVKP